MRLSWPLRIILPVGALLLVSWWIGPPHQPLSSPPQSTANDGQDCSPRRPMVTSEAASSIRSGATTRQLEAQLDRAGSPEEVLALLPSACMVDINAIQQVGYDAPLAQDERRSTNTTQANTTQANTTQANTTRANTVAASSSKNAPANSAAPLNRYPRVIDKTLEGAYPNGLTQQFPTAAFSNPQQPGTAQQGAQQSESSPSDRPGIEPLPPTNPDPRSSSMFQQPAQPYAPHSLRQPTPAVAADGEDPHCDVFSRSAYPSATECATCHQQIFDEWAISNHAYAAVSPMFHRFEQKINTLAQGTIGYFCMRCHAPVAVTMGLRRDQPIWDGPRVFREGVTCVACHRVKEQYSKVNGERRMEPGDLSQPVYGSGDGAGVAKAIEYQDYYKVRPYVDDKGPGQTIHRKVIQFEQLSRSDFCASCHQVAVDPGIKLEVVWDQYRASPACREGISCQDCHMGRVPGVAAGYSVGPTAVISNRVVNPAKKHSNHVFYGPGASIAHPGIFPQNPKADRWTFNDWLQFDWRAGWGTDDFEDRVDRGELHVNFPPVWSNVDDRYDAREILNDNLQRLKYKDELRQQVLENGSKVDGPFFTQQPALGQDLRFFYQVTNTNPGHNLPSGSLGAQPQVWLNVVLIGPDGRRVFESGHLDSNGDMADRHSHDVLQGRIPHDDQLFNLQTKFLTTNVKGTDREMYLPINVDFDQLPFIRPGAQPITVINHPPFIRMEAHSLPPLGSRRAKYKVPGACLTQPGTYRLSVRIRSRAEPIYFMDFVESTPEMKQAMIDSIMDVHAYSVQFTLR